MRLIPARHQMAGLHCEDHGFRPYSQVRMAAYFLLSALQAVTAGFFPARIAYSKPSTRATKDA